MLRPTFFPKRRGVQVMPLFVFNCAQLLAIHTLPSPTPHLPIEQIKRLGSGCIELNEAAGRSEKAGKLWKFNWGIFHCNWAYVLTKVKKIVKNSMCRIVFLLFFVFGCLILSSRGIRLPCRTETAAIKGEFSVFKFGANQ